MKNIFFFLVFINLFINSIAQVPCNLIRNGNFESYSSCPTGNGQMNRAVFWSDGTTSGGSSDYFHSVCPFMNVGGGITPPLPFPSGVGCAGVYTNHNSGWNGYYKEEFAQKLNFCAGQKYTLSLYAAKPATGSYINLQGNLSFKIGNAPVLPTNAFDPVTRCETGFTEETFVQGNLITSSWQRFTRTFTASQNANAFLVSGNCLGPYTVTGYAFVDSMVLTTVDTMIVSSTTIATCDTAAFTITVPGGCYGPYDFVITDGTSSSTISNVPSGYTHIIYPAPVGTYTITSITNNFGCTTPLNIAITITGGTSVSVTQNPSICSGQNYALPGGNIVNTAGTYYDTIPGAGGCDSIITTNLTVGSAVSSSQNQTICSGQSFTLPAGGIVNSTGTYIDTISLGAGCDSIITTNLTVTPALTGSQNQTICAGQNYTLPGGSIVTTSGTYVDTISTISGCDSIVTTNLNINPAVFGSQSPTICIGQNYTLPGGLVVSTAGTYTDTVLSSSGCDSIVTTNLSVSNLITSNQNPILCVGTNFTLPSGNVVNASGTYIDTIPSIGGCDSIVTTTLTYNPTSAFSQNPVICSNSNFTLPDGSVVNTTGTYTQTLLNYHGCDSVITTNLTVNAIPTAVTTPTSVSIQPGNSTSLSASGGGTYLWFPTNNLTPTTGNLVTAEPSVTTTYCVEITDANNCKDTACVTVTVELPCPELPNLIVPNAFSPNGDGVNDEFCLQGWNACINNFTIYIYDRWGEKVYESKDPSFCWNGIKNGSIMDPQVFVYVIKATYTNITEVIERTGNISLIK